MVGLRGVVGVAVGVVCLATVAAALPIPANYRVSGPAADVQNEEQVWICPNNPAVILANHRDFRTGTREIALARSVNGGVAWTDSLVDDAFHVLRRHTDPMMVGMSDGSIVAGYLDHAYDGDVFDSSYITFIMSDNCGLTWDGPYTVEDSVGYYLEDKPFATSDRSGDHSTGICMCHGRASQRVLRIA